MTNLYIINECGNRGVQDGHTYIQDPRDNRFILRVAMDGEVLGQFDKHEE